mmetsp:Transcript_20390/g.30515  ORF Transcript_20390/g.30515 Transcript_20390/m.30515 type:complete len:123 (+) Transcript_20390:91-459(+)
MKLKVPLFLVPTEAEETVEYNKASLLMGRYAWETHPDGVDQKWKYTFDLLMRRKYAHLELSRVIAFTSMMREERFEESRHVRSYSGSIIRTKKSKNKANKAEKSRGKSNQAELLLGGELSLL